MSSELNFLRFLIHTVTDLPHITKCTGWRIRFYVDDSVPSTVINQLRNEESEIVHVDQMVAAQIPGTFWRFWVNDDPLVDR